MALIGLLLKQHIFNGNSPGINGLKSPVHATVDLWNITINGVSTQKLYRSSALNTPLINPFMIKPHEILLFMQIFYPREGSIKVLTADKWSCKRQK